MGTDITATRSVLLTTAWSGGTLAAARNLHANGIDVRIISTRRLSAATWSRSVSKTYLGPPESQNELFLDRLFEIGARDPGQVLLPASDETAWLYTVNAAKLRDYFLLYQPSIATLRCILDKGNLTEAAALAGLDVLPIWDPSQVREISDSKESVPYPLLIKPRSHIHRRSTHKGVIVQSKFDLISFYKQYLDREDATPDPLLPEIGRPILQPFISAGSEGIHSITGFIDRTGDLFVARHSKKVFQRSPPLGIGICFESLPAAPALSQGVHRLCREIGYFGIFEVEFVFSRDRWRLIDFNPRLFHQLGMDIARGVPLPLLALLDATGDTEALRRAVTRINLRGEEERVVLCDRFLFYVFLFAQTLTSRMSRKDRSYWRKWMADHAAHSVDLVRNKNDPWPAVIYCLSEVIWGIKRFPQFLHAKPVGMSSQNVETQPL